MKFHNLVLATAALLSDAAGAQTCVPSTTGEDLQARINATPSGGTLVLCQRALIQASGVLTLKPYLKLETEGRPASDADKAKIVLTTLSNAFPFAIGQSFISAYGMSGVELRNLVIDGGRTSVTKYKHAILETQTSQPDHWRATLAVGGTNTLIDHVSITNAIGGAAIDAASDPYCFGLRITNSHVGQVGFHQTAANTSGQRIGQWADGLNLFCSNAYIAGNHFRDVTDGSISFYGGTNTIIEGNWIALSGRSGVSAFVAAAAKKGTAGFAVNFAGSKFQNNLIETAPSQHFNVAISLGSKGWCSPTANNPDCQTVEGMSALYNSGTGTFGFGILVAGMNAATVIGNNLIGTLS